MTPREKAAVESSLASRPAELAAMTIEGRQALLVRQRAWVEYLGERPEPAIHRVE